MCKMKNREFGYVSWLYLCCKTVWTYQILYCGAAQKLMLEMEMEYIVPLWGVGGWGRGEGLE